MKLGVSFLLWCFLEGSPSHHAVHSFEFHRPKKLEAGRAYSLRRIDFSLGSRTRNTDFGDRNSDGLDNAESNIERQKAMVGHSTVTEEKNSPSSEWFPPHHNGLFGIDPVLAMSPTTTTTTTTQTIGAYDHVGAVGILAWMICVSAFVLANNFIGPWPNFGVIPYNTWLLLHQLGGMVFGGGVFLTACIEQLVSTSKNAEVQRFWFRKVPWLNGAIVLPGLTLSIVSGMALSTIRYGRLSSAPPHVIYTFWTLVVFAAWFAFTDLTTQSEALEAVLSPDPHEQQQLLLLQLQHHHLEQESPPDDATFETNTTSTQTPTLVLSSSSSAEVPQAVNQRMLSNAVSCGFVVLLYAIMILKLGTIQYW